MDNTPYIWPAGGHCGGLDADGLVVKDVPLKGHGRIRLLNKDKQPVGDEVPAFGCAAAGKVGEIVPVHRHQGHDEWHLVDMVDD